LNYTTNLNLRKPEYTDYADIADINANMDTIDIEIAAKGTVKTVNGVSPDSSGAVTIAKSNIGIYYGSTAPSSPATGDIWFAPA
jgi:hypothetical protein